MKASIDTLPGKPFTVAGPVRDRFVDFGIGSLRGAAEYLWQLPYGRNANRKKFCDVLTEGRGTCSSKHALWAALANEQGHDAQLTLAIYEMTEANTPGVGEILANYGLGKIPEAHCYLRSQGCVIDITHPLTSEKTEKKRYIYAEVIQPKDVIEYKVVFHQNYMRRWAARAHVRGMTFAQLWDIREACIAALSRVSSAPIGPSPTTRRSPVPSLVCDRLWSATEVPR